MQIMTMVVTIIGCADRLSNMTDDDVVTAHYMCDSVADVSLISNWT